MNLSQIRILRYPDIYSLTQLMRISEFWCNPELKFTYFTADKCRKWFKRKFHINYERYFEGLNIPGEMFRQFSQVFADDMTSHEKIVCDMFKDIEDDFYVIAFVKSDERCLGHELCHALYQCDLYWAHDATNLVWQFDYTAYKTITKGLKEKMAYDDNVLMDEAIAYLTDGGADLVSELKMDIKPLKPLIKELRKLFVKRLELIK